MSEKAGWKNARNKMEVARFLHQRDSYYEVFYATRLNNIEVYKIFGGHHQRLDGSRNHCLNVPRSWDRRRHHGDCRASITDHVSFERRCNRYGSSSKARAKAIVVKTENDLRA